LIDQPEKQEDIRSLDPQEIKEGLPVWVQLHKRGARVAATIRGHSEDRSRCTVDLEIDDPIHPGPGDSPSVSYRCAQNLMGQFVQGTQGGTYEESPVFPDWQPHTSVTVTGQRIHL
jgi:hypothetical protein